MFSTCTFEITQYALNQRSPARSGKVKGRSSYKQHALKGQKLLAQGSALGYYVRKPVAL